MLVQARPQLLESFKFVPHAQTGNCSGLFRCHPDTQIWELVHSLVVEKCLREQYAGVTGLTPEERDYIQSTRGIHLLHSEFMRNTYDPCFAEKLDANLDVFPLANGVVDMRTREFRATRADNHVRLHAGWSYDADAAREHRDDVEGFWAQLLPVEEERRVFLTYVAGLLSGRRAIKKMIVLTDRQAGNNGKSTAVNMLRAFFGGLSKTNNRLLNKSAFERDRDAHDAGFASFRGVRVTLLEELKRTMRFDEGLVKLLTGGAGVSVEGRHCGSADTYRFVW
jgi:phage/plasmid-associated DNA primase